MRSLRVVTVLLFTLSSIAVSQEVNLSGTVLDDGGAPVETAIVRLISNGASDTTSSDGTYEIATVDVLPGVESLSPVPFAVGNNHVRITLDAQRHVCLELLDARGRCLELLWDGILEKGEHRLPFSVKRTASQVCFVRLTGGADVSTRKTVSFVRGGSSATRDRVKRSSVLSKTGQEALDSLRVRKPGYLPEVLPVLDYNATIDFSIRETELADMRLADGIDGWSEESAAYSEFDPAGLFGIINGGAPVYNDNGLIVGSHCYMESTTGKGVEVFVMNFGTPGNAVIMYDEMVETSIWDPVPLTAYDSTIALGSGNLGGAVIYAHLGKFFFSLSYTGYAADRDSIVSDAEIFLAEYEFRLGY